ncbi:Bifunctional aspartokinase/homoserine dehydrogenase 1 [Abeliophyllum distichum]|uniref:aspartate kinase n=1 Tax=Abeliophyllum distichum TaxID=126358 RepID=A0ABD1S9R9_9LAMI
MAFASPISSSCSLHNLCSNAISRDPRKNLTTLSKIHPFPLLHRSRIDYCSQWEGRGSPKFNIFASVASADIALDEAVEKAQFPKGDTWSIHKFGGTCVGTSERIRNVADIIVKDESERKLVVVSAMSKVTDMMYDLIIKAQSRDDSYITALDAVLEKHKSTALDLLEGDGLSNFLSQLHQDISNLKAMLRAIYIAGHATETFSDFVVGHGELWSAQLLSSVIRKNGLGSNCMDTREVLVVNPTSTNQVDPDYLESGKRLEKWYSENPSNIIVATGFIATTPQNIPTTLKRDGSDFSAAIMGALFGARQVTIWTDVDGVYSADPRKVSEAVILKTLSYQEAWEMSYFGANVLHPRTIIPVMKYDIPIVIRNIFNLSAPGTMICRPVGCENENGQRLESPVKGFATIDNLALVNVEGTGMAGVPGTASAIFSAVKDVGANVIMISQASSEHSVCFAVPETEVKAVSMALESRFRQALDAGRLSQIAVIPNCSILATVGQKMASTPGVSARLFNALAKANINIRAIAQGCSEHNITVVVKREDCIRALRAVHSRFYLSRTTIAMGIIGPGLIGGTLLDQLRAQDGFVLSNINTEKLVSNLCLSNSLCETEVISTTSLNGAENSSFQLTVEKLNGRNYREWAQSIKLVIDGKGKLEFLTGEKKKPEAIDATSLQKWKSENSLVIAWLVNSMKPTIEKTYLFLPTAKDVWDAVKETYSDSENSSQIFEIKTKLCQLKQREREVTNYYMDMCNLWQELDLSSEEDWECSADSAKYKKRLEIESFLVLGWTKLQARRREGEDSWPATFAFNTRSFLRSEKRGDASPGDDERRSILWAYWV